MKSFHYLYTQIAGRQQQFQWQVNLRVAIAEQFFVDDCQERVPDFGNASPKILFQVE